MDKPRNNDVKTVNLKADNSTNTNINTNTNPNPNPESKTVKPDPDNTSNATVNPNQHFKTTYTRHNGKLIPLLTWDLPPAALAFGRPLEIVFDKDA
jgi:hypothetical protein